MKNIIFVILFSVSITAAGQRASVRISTQSSWPPGKMVPVTVEITRGEAKGFARFYQNLPQGFIVENVSGGGADFFRDNNQVNYVWLDLPEDQKIVVQYLAQADALLSGSFKITGRFDYIVKGSERISVTTEPFIVTLDKNADVENVEFATEQSDQITAEDSAEESVTAGKDIITGKGVDVDFRVQVSISSQRFSQEELEERIGCSLKHGITVLRTGTMYKYQSGSFDSYSAASEYLEEMKSGGVTDAFIVAFRGSVPIHINEARALTEK